MGTTGTDGAICEVIAEAGEREARIGKTVFQIRCEIDRMENNGNDCISLAVARGWMMDVARSL